MDIYSLERIDQVRGAQENKKRLYQFIMKDISREELLRSKEYWTADIQLKLFAEIEEFMKSHQMNRTQFAEYLGCTKGYVTQLLSGDFDNKLSKMVELSLAIGKIPAIEFKSVDQYIQTEGSVYRGFDDAQTEGTYRKTHKVKPIYCAA